jgi:hypothetical protein
MTQPLHIALEKDLYKKSKANILASEIAILNSMKHLYAIRQTQLQQQELRKRVFEAFDFIKQRMDRLAGRKLPEVKEIPKNNYRKEQIKMGTKLPSDRKREMKIQTTDQRGRTIEDELENIQRKLEMLNG